MHCKTAVFICQPLSHQFLHPVDLHVVCDHWVQMDHQIRSVFFQTFPFDLIHHLMTCQQIVVFVKFHMNTCIAFSRTVIVHHQVMTAKYHRISHDLLCQFFSKIGFHAFAEKR